jgi:hypothetical protein
VSGGYSTYSSETMSVMSMAMSVWSWGLVVGQFGRLDTVGEFSVRDDKGSLVVPVIWKESTAIARIELFQDRENDRYRNNSMRLCIHMNKNVGRPHRKWNTGTKWWSNVRRDWPAIPNVRRNWPAIPHLDRNTELGRGKQTGSCSSRCGYDRDVIDQRSRRHNCDVERYFGSVREGSAQYMPTIPPGAWRTMDASSIAFRRAPRKLEARQNEPTA